MRILVGLGNPGPDYRTTRHNVGFLVVDEVRRRHGNPPEERGARCRFARVRLGRAEILAARPQTYMNRSGLAVAALLDRESVAPADLLVVCDDLHLDLGAIRLRQRGSHGGHNGLRSIIEALGTDEFARLRIGVGPSDQGVDHVNFVLAPFPASDKVKLDEVVGIAADCVETVAREGITRAMTRFNRRLAPQAG